MKLRMLLILLVLLAATALQAQNFQFSKWGYTWTTDSGDAPGPGTFSPSHVTPLSSGIGLTLTETSSGSIVGAEARTLHRFLYGTFQWTEYVPIQASGQITAGFLYYTNSITEIDFEQEGDLPNTFWGTNWVGVYNKQYSSICCYTGTVPHTLKIVWKPWEVDYWVDGVKKAVHSKDVPYTAAYFIFNFWGTNSTSWGGLLTPGTRNYVVSNWSYSPGY